MESKRHNPLLGSLVGHCSEVVGRVEEVHNHEIILSFRRKRCVIPVRSEGLRKWKSDLKVGCQVAILLLDDGSIRVKRP